MALRFAFLFLHYLEVNDNNAMKRARLTAWERERWCLAQLPVSRTPLILAQELKYFCKIATSLKSIWSTCFLQKAHCLCLVCLAIRLLSVLMFICLRDLSAAV